MAEQEVLADLEQTVRAAVRDLSGLRKENRRLEARLRELEADREEPAEAGWRRERDEFRRRVESLAGSLEELL